MQFLYQEENGYALMDQESFEQMTLPESMIDNGQFLKEGDIVDLLYDAAKELPLSAELPQTVVLQITYTEPGLRGDTATNTLKSATVETGAEVRVPLFCDTGDFIKIDTATGSDMERVKK